MVDAKRAVLSVWDSSRGGEVVDLEVTWSVGFDEDARISIPVRLKSTWEAGVEALRGAPIEPYPGLPIRAESNHINRSATAFYGVALYIWGSGAGWRVWPPYPESETKADPGVVQ